MTRYNTTAGLIQLPDLTAAQCANLKVTLHWTAGTYDVGSAPEHYHFVIDGNGQAVMGGDIEKNLKPLKTGYVAHVRHANTNNIGISVAAMAGASWTEAMHGRYGNYPMTQRQVLGLIAVTATVVRHFGIPLIPQRVLGHEEWDSIHGVKQDRWDICVIPHLDIRPVLTPNGTYTAMNWLRAQVAEALKSVQTTAPAADFWWKGEYMAKVIEAQRVLYEAADKLPFSPYQMQEFKLGLNKADRQLHDAGFKA